MSVVQYSSISASSFDVRDPEKPDCETRRFGDVVDCRAFVLDKVVVVLNPKEVYLLLSLR